MIYLASPFRDPDPMVQKRRCEAVDFVAANLFLEGKFVFSPLTHNRILIELIEDRVPKEHWMAFDLHILKMCTRLYVLALPGWENSKGVAKEIAFAKEHQIPISMIDPPAIFLDALLKKSPLKPEALPK